MKLSEIPYWDYDSIIQVCRILPADLDIIHSEEGGITIKCMASLNEKVKYGEITKYSFKNTFQALAEYFGAEIDSNGEFSNKRLKGSICFGEAGGETLFVDANTGSIGIYYHDGAEIALIADSFHAFLSECSDIRAAGES